jgi:peptidoglycan/xylan/chitin deacetylase (PgdA/CDA1 family)
MRRSGGAGLIADRDPPLPGSAAPRIEPVGYGARDEGFDARRFLEERYGGRSRSSVLLSAYYRAKPVLPRGLQLALRRADARRRRRRHEEAGAFPRWPAEPLLVERREAHFRDRMLRAGTDRVPFVGYWPHGHRFALAITHDVEGPAGLANVDRILALERRHGVVSSWNLVAEDYAVAPELLERIRAAGGEIGLHALSHDGRLFAHRAGFERQLPRIRRYLHEWGAEGFRSPSTHRNAAWMPELGARYDSSFPDTDPFEPQPGGCCSILPYFLGEMVELPITLPQDHTVFEILREPDDRIWHAKARWIAQHGGLATLLTHPDYLLDEARLRRYDALLGFLRGLDGGWHALPRDIARWWRTRARLEAALAGGEPEPADLLAAGASVAWAVLDEHGALAIETGAPE